MALVLGLVIAGLAAAVGAYFTIPHVALRVDRFVDPASPLNWRGGPFKLAWMPW